MREKREKEDNLFRWLLKTGGESIDYEWSAQDIGSKSNKLKTETCLVARIAYYWKIV